MDKKRCFWVPEDSEIYVKYHDCEWGVPRYDDDILYEMFLLETFQAGLSWITILKKREAFRAAFDGFDIFKIASYGEDKIQELLQDPGIIRCRRKIEAAVKNAGIILDIKREFGSFSNYLWGFTDGKVVKNPDGSVYTRTPLSDRISADMKRRGMKYVGSVTIYSYLQAVGIVNDHSPDCFRYNEV